MNSKLVVAAISLAVLSAAIAFYCRETAIDVFTPPKIPGSDDLLHLAERIHIPGAVGPESLAFDSDGEGPYTGVADGRILKWETGGDSNKWVEFAVTSSQRNECSRPFAPEVEHICGRPLGLRFHKKTGDLYIADAYLGLQVVGPTGGMATQLVTEVDGRPLYFTNDMDIDEKNNVIYFTDSSMKYHRREFLPAALTLDKTGRLMKYDISSEKATVLLDGLVFPNGVALSDDRSFMLVSETTTCRIIRFWLQGPKAGKHEIFVDVPGFPDNIRRNFEGDFWVALHSKRALLVKLVLSNSLLGKMLLKLPLTFQQLHYLIVGGKPHATAVKLSKEGKILRILEDVEGTTLRFISEVEERKGKLWAASVLMSYIGIYNLE